MKSNGMEKEMEGLGTGEIIYMEGSVHLLYGWGALIEVCFLWNVVALGGRR